jgi:hypothetical protein
MGPPATKRKKNAKTRTPEYKGRDHQRMTCFHELCLVESWTSKFMKTAAPIVLPPNMSEPTVAAPIEETLKKSSAIITPSLSPATALPKDYSESPLTKAKRIYSQNAWREQQLEKFISSKTEKLKSALGNLRHEGKPEIRTEEQALVDSDSLKSGTVKVLSEVHKTKITEDSVKVPLTRIPVRIEKHSTAFGNIADEAPPEHLQNDTPIPRDVLDHDIEPMHPEESNIPVKPILSQEEELRRQRLRERQEKAIDRKKQLLKKAMDAKVKPEDPAPFKKPSVVIRPSGSAAGANSLHKTAILNNALVLA